ncbi:MAG: TetR/AcrR family transcriptional regulator [Hydrogenophaga sp.]|nr:TetR/AcrR family transcriptional regulator [Hydrogenophaga sp.]MBW0186212.1 TetR/AcrR family transcriptional regulator [Hydrogenophaga sp.]
MRIVAKVDRSVYSAAMSKKPDASISDLSAKERILHTAHDLFYAEGLRATGIDRVIAEAGVTKVTFYRHFPSKNDLIVAYLNFRHERWMQWFTEALERHGGATKGVQVLPSVLKEWFRGKAMGDFRGCAFLNSVSEMGPAMPAVVEVTRQHKQQMAEAIEALLPPSAQRKRTAEALACAVDGAIVQAQYSGDPAPALRALGFIADQLTQKA